MLGHLMSFIPARDDDWEADSLQTTVLSVLSSKRVVRCADHHRYSAYRHSNPNILDYYLLHVRSPEKRGCLLYVLPIYVSFSFLVLPFRD
jgi:hypothetical protein